jgi:uncharacterized protein (UPF0332 family)
MGKHKETDIGRLELAQLMLGDARFNLQHRRYRCAISRSYYACHHAARACLDMVGQPLQKSRSGAHKACIKLFGLHCIKTKLLSIALSDTLKELLELREAADYELSINAIENVAKQYYQRAENFLSEVENYAKTKI